LFTRELVTGLAHITGGGIRENLDRILPKDLDARISLAKYRTPEVFERIRQAANASDDTMLRTFNLGVGLAVVCREADAQTVIDHLIAAGEQAYVIGEIVIGSGAVVCT
jgi:phosphoribosylformylglycinamidine cyclo-ligase